MKKSIRFLSVMLCAVTLLSAAACGKTKVTAKVIDIELTQEDYAFGVDKESAELLNAVNELINEIKSNGKLEEIMNKYFGEGTPSAVTSAKLDESKDQLVVATNANSSRSSIWKATNSTELIWKSPP